MTTVDVAATSAAPRRRLRLAGWREAAWGVASIVLFFVLWTLLAAVTNHFHAGLIPTPGDVASSFWHLTTHRFAGRILPLHVLSSLGRWGIGFVVAIALGVPLGILLGAVGVVRAAVAPLFELLRYVPPFAWIPLAVLWLGTGETSQSLVVFIAAFPAVVISTEVGASGVDPALVRAGRVLGAGSVRRLATIIAPVALPGIFTGIRVAASNGWMALIAAELIGGRVGVGFLISQGQDNGDTAGVMAGMAAIGITAAALDLGVIAMGRRLTRWRSRAGT